MEIKFKKLNDKAINPIVNQDGTVSVYASEVLQALDATNRPVIVYKTGLTTIIPNGYNLLIMPAKMNVVRSVILSKDMLYSNSLIVDNDELMIEYKIDTNVIPATYTVGDEVARLYLIKQEDTSIDVEEYIAPVESVTEEPQIDDHMENEVISDVKRCDGDCEACTTCNASTEEFHEPCINCMNNKAEVILDSANEQWQDAEVVTDNIETV